MESIKLSEYLVLLLAGTCLGCAITENEVNENRDIIKEEMMFKVHMEGTVNGHFFVVEGKGKGSPYNGDQTVKVTVTKGGPLPFAWDILSPQVQYGSQTFVKHPKDIPDYQKLSFPEGFKWERVMSFEDGGVITVTQDTRLEGNCLIYEVKLIGVNFPSDGPVMQKKTLGWEPTTECLYPHNGLLRGHSHMILRLEGGGHYLSEAKTIIRAKKQVQMPGYYFSDVKLDITSHNGDYTVVEQREMANARHHLLQ